MQEHIQQINENEMMTSSDLDLFKQYQSSKKFDENGKIINSDLNLRNIIAKRNAKLVTFVINKFYSKKIKHKELRNDLLQEGHLGLFDAIDGFKPDLGFKFSTYATWWIRQSVNSYLLDEEPMFHIPSHIRTAKNKLQNLAKEHAIPMQSISKEMLEEIGMTNKMFASVSAADKAKAWNHVCLDSPVSSSGDSSKTLQDTIPCNIADLTSSFDNKKLIAAALRAFEKLNSREKNVLLLRYGIDNHKMIKNEIGESK